MFTGLIEEIGTIKDVSITKNGAHLTIECSKIIPNTIVGDSIAVNGVCQTVTESGSTYFKTDLSLETLNVTTFNNTSNGCKVNLERALKIENRLGGHIVTGHVDSKAKYIKEIEEGFSHRFFFETSKDTAKYIVAKGSITINGISLTIAAINNCIFSVEIIPITIQNTNLKYLKSGDFVNIETDIIAKYVEKFLSLNNNNTTTIDENLLKENGFL